MYRKPSANDAHKLLESAATMTTARTLAATKTIGEGATAAASLAIGAIFGLAVFVRETIADSALGTLSAFFSGEVSRC